MNLSLNESGVKNFGFELILKIENHKINDLKI